MIEFSFFGAHQVRPRPNRQHRCVTPGAGVQKPRDVRPECKTAVISFHLMGPLVGAAREHVGPVKFVKKPAWFLQKSLQLGCVIGLVSGSLLLCFFCVRANKPWLQTTEQPWRPRPAQSLQRSPRDLSVTKRLTGPDALFHADPVSLSRPLSRRSAPTSSASCSPSTAPTCWPAAPAPSSPCAPSSTWDTGER